MKKEYKTEQEKFWAGDFGKEYIKRNQGEDILASNLSFFGKICSKAQKIDSILELGSNIGMNLKSLKLLFPKAKITGVEINEEAYSQLKEIEGIDAVHGSIFDFKTEEKYDLTFTRGVLIHINPNELENVYKCLYESSKRYICVAEYFSTTPEALPYRGEDDKLFKRDFAGEIMDQYPDLELVDYGFSYRRDPNFLQGDITWFLMEKKA